MDKTPALGAKCHMILNPPQVGSFVHYILYRFFINTINQEEVA